MKIKSKSIALVLLALVTIIAQPSSARAQGTAFTYQGLLNSSGSPVNGSYDLTFALFSVGSGAGQVGNTLTNSATAVSNGLFAVVLDFGASFPGADRWLEIGVRTNGSGSFSTLFPRQKLFPTPYAIFANTASNVSGTVSVANLPSTVALLNNSGTLNFFAGGNAGNSTLTGQENTGVGYFALADLTSGGQNAANGTGALLHNTSGSGNTANGDDALNANTTGSFNTASGKYALVDNTTGYGNTANGTGALQNNTTGSYNAANGMQALAANTSGSYNVANGNAALLASTTGSYNTANGYEALQTTITASTTRPTARPLW